MEMAYKKKQMQKIFIYAVLVLCAIVVIYPFFYMVMNSFKTGPEIQHNPTALPQGLSFEGYTGMFDTLNVPLLFFNTTLVAGILTLLNTFISAMVAYGIVKTDVPGKKILFRIILASMMIPGILLTIPTYMMMYSWDWINTYRVLIFPGSVSAYNIFLVIQFMKQVDDAYLEAARIDGAGEWDIFCKIVLPMCKPVLATVFILAFMGSWNDLFGPLLYIRDKSLWTLQLGLYRFNTSTPGTYLEQIYAAMTFITIPVVIVFLFLQKNFIKAFTGIGLK